MARDRAVVWHPYAAMPSAYPSVPVVSAEGTRLRLADGRELIDGMSSWWAAIHGYRHPALDAAIELQLREMSHVMFGGLTHPTAIDLAELLVERGMPFRAAHALVGGLVRDSIERHVPLQRALLGQIHFRHAAPAQPSQHAIVPHLPTGQVGFGGRFRRHGGCGHEGAQWRGR